MRRKPADVPNRAGFICLVAMAALLPGCGEAGADGSPARGQAAIGAYGCTACHEIAGIRGVSSRVGPPLLAVGRQSYIAGVLPNTRANMTAWLENPPAMAPNTAMPNLGVTPAEARDITAYLYTLRGTWP